MVKMNNNELQLIVGGVNWTGTLVSAVTKLVTSVVDIGRYIGSATRRLVTGKCCSV